MINNIIKTLIVLILFMTANSCSFLLNRKSSNAINDEQAFKYFLEAQEQFNSGSEGFQNSIDLLDKAYQIEPKNAVILHDRGLYKFNSKIDVQGAFIDLENSIKYSTDDKMTLYMYNNRALCYMDICDIKSACADWEKSGKYSQVYLDKYCNNLPDTSFQNNQDNDLEIQLELIDHKAIITSTHNSENMSTCMANIKLINNAVSNLNIQGSSFDYGLEHDTNSLFLEAKNDNGEKFIFFTNSTYSYYSPNKDTTIRKGETFSHKQNLTYVHQFPYPGNYEIRVALRPSTRVKGIKKTYYSNWETLKIER